MKLKVGGAAVSMTVGMPDLRTFSDKSSLHCSREVALSRRGLYLGPVQVVGRESFIVRRGNAETATMPDVVDDGTAVHSSVGRAVDGPSTVNGDCGTCALPSACVMASMWSCYDRPVVSARDSGPT